MAGRAFWEGGMVSRSVAKAGDGREGSLETEPAESCCGMFYGRNPKLGKAGWGAKEVSIYYPIRSTCRCLHSDFLPFLKALKKKSDGVLQGQKFEETPSAAGHRGSTSPRRRRPPYVRVFATSLLRPINNRYDADSIKRR